MKRFVIIAAILVAPVLCAQESFVQLPPNSTGAKLRMRCNTISANVVCSQGFFIDDGTGSNPLGIGANPLFVTFTNATIAATQSGTWTVNDQHSNVTADYDTGAGTQNLTMYGLALPASGGAVAAPGDSTNGLKVQVTTAPTTTVTGTVTSNIGTTNGLALDATLTGGSQKTKIVDSGGTNVATVSAAGAVKVDGSAATQPISASSLPLPTSAATDASVTGLQVAQASTTSGQKGALTQGAVTTAAPTYTTAQTSPLSLTTTGALRTDASGTTQPVSCTNCSGTVTVSGTVTTTPPTNASTNVAQVNGVTTSTGNGIAGTGVQRVAIASDNTAFAVNNTQQGTASQNVAQVNGVAIATGNGVSGTGVQRVTLASDSTGQVALAAGAATIGALTANQSVNENQIAGAAIATVASGVQKVGIVGNAGATVDSTVAAGTAPTNAVVTGGVYNSTAPAPTTGQAMSAQLDQAGNLKQFPGIATATLSVWNSGTALNATQAIFSNSGVGAVLVHVVQTTTLTAGAITFEVSYDNSNWVTIPADAVLDPSGATYAQIVVPYTVQASTNKPFLLMSKGWQGLRIKLSTAITGTGTVTPNYALLPFEPAKTVIALSPTAANFNVTTTPPSNASTNIAQINGVTPLMGNGTAGTGSLRVTVSSDNTPFAVKTDQTTHGTTDLVAGDITKIGGTAVVSAGVAGALAVGGIGANNTAITENPQLAAIEAQSGQPTAATTGNKRQMVGSLDGALYVRPNGPVLWNCGLTAIAATLTQCQAAPSAGLKLYITDIQVGSNTATGGSFLVRYGTGSNCGTGTTSIYPNIAAQTAGVMPYPPNTASFANINFTSPPVAAAANALCVICVATNTCVINMTGYTAP